MIIIDDMILNINIIKIYNSPIFDQNLLSTLYKPIIYKNDS